MDAILIVNSGSSTIKFALYSIGHTGVGGLTQKYKGIVDHILAAPDFKAESPNKTEKVFELIPVSGSQETYYQLAIEYILAWFLAKGFNIVAVGHRIVHSGPDYSAPIILNDEIITKLFSYVPIMPLHQPYNLNGVKILQMALPNAIQVGCFDTGFHVTCNPISQLYVLPKKFRTAGIRRYGFHGLSYEYIASKLPDCMSKKVAQGKFVVAHLGNGATMCAIENQKSVATSIGMTGIGGLPMGTRCDSIDPGTVLYMLDAYKLTTNQLLNIFYKESGLLGLSELSSDMRDLLASDKPEAKLAIQVFVHRISIFAGLLTAELQGIDGLIFTGGIGENASPIRQMVCERLKWLEINIDAEANEQKSAHVRKISSKDSKTSVWVIPTNEEVVIAKHTYEKWQARRESNPQPTVLETAALPIELLA